MGNSRLESRLCPDSERSAKELKFGKGSPKFYCVIEDVNVYSMGGHFTHQGILKPTLLYLSQIDTRSPTR